MKKLLVHICCGPCSIYPLKQALSGEMEVTGFFFNPNIQPRDEYLKREEAVRRLSELMELDVIYAEPRSSELFVRDFMGRRLRGLPKDDRCDYCYALRLEATARAASKEGFDAFTSSLLYSRYQEHARIVDLSKSFADRYGVDFFYRDFREGWQEGLMASKEMGLYRQKYCGCVYSWMERYGIEPGKGETQDVAASK